MIDYRDLASRWQTKSVLELWNDQVVQHHRESYKGIGLAKFPQDLWNYEKLLELSNPEVVIEIGVNEGGFTRWLYDRLLLAKISDSEDKRRTVIGLDINIENARMNLAGLPDSTATGVDTVLIQCDLLSSASLEKANKRIASIIDGRSTLVIEDSAHTYSSTKAALDCFGRLLKPGEWLVVEDTCVDIELLRESEDWPRGALDAVNDFLRGDQSFERTDFNHTYEITCHPFGFLRKRMTTVQR